MKDMNPNGLEAVHAYWQAANYLSAGQIFLKANPLLREPLQAEHIKPRLMGHWGTCPGLNLVWAHCNRLIRNTGMRLVFIAGPGHGAPAVLSCAYLDGSFTEHYPAVTEDAEGMRLLFRQFSSPGGMPSHVSPLTPGSLHEGGELGYCLSHAFGAVFDDPGLVAVCVIGDGEAETGPLEGSWKSIHFLHPQRDGAVLPILHMNGYKIASPTILGRYSNDELIKKFSGEGYAVRIVEGSDPEDVHGHMAAAMDEAYDRIISIKRSAGKEFNSHEAGWPLIILKTPKGWTGPETLSGKQVEGSFRSHQVPLEEVKHDDIELAALEKWLRSYEPEKLFDPAGKLTAPAASNIPPAALRMGNSPYANGGNNPQPLRLPETNRYRINAHPPGTRKASATKEVGKFLRDVFVENREHNNFRLFCPDEASSNKLDAVFEVTSRCSMLPVHGPDEHIGPEGRVFEVLSEHLCQGWLEGYLLTGKHGLFATYEAFAPITDSMLTQFAKWLKGCRDTP
ncbi:hypothetical protein CCY01nite_43250 [Chitinophaga cymbidii]|uniref:Xylulose 5-phosphate/Fructose 6-phosphate phosphoketolase N-terminal domain-containing protein n=1 Tax=Chitinophaga cymbidii TaxID=1096750 RepID=A0A512RQU6_9BACT|nr:hypothetical protein CCY01nite_43250 [Chitinophaga cymbidii]